MQGSYVYDINGNKYLDSLAGLWCTTLGMCTRLLCLFLGFSNVFAPVTSASSVFVMSLGGSEPRLVKAATEGAWLCCAIRSIYELFVLLHLGTMGN